MKSLSRFKYLLLFRWIVVNLVGFFLLGLAYLNGWVGLVVSSDQTFISSLIFALFIWGLTLSGIRIFKTSRELNHAKEQSSESKWKKLVDNMHSEKMDPSQIIEALKLKMFARISIVKWFANALVLLGLIGTVVGFIIALSGVDPSKSSDVAAIGAMVATLISGMGTALYTTLVGSITNLWLMANYHILSEGTANLLATLLESKVRVEEVVEAVEETLDIENGVDNNE